MSENINATTVYAEATPNPSTMKFVADRLIVNGDFTAEYTHWSKVRGTSPLAEELYRFMFIKSLFFSGNFVTVTKIDDISWDYITMEIREFIQSFLRKNQWAVTKQPLQDDACDTGEGTVRGEHAIPTNEIEFKIVELLDEYVKPAVENDGGAIHFKSYDKGTVYLYLRGACSGCPSSRMTLKGGIESLLKQYIPQVEDVVAVDE